MMDLKFDAEGFRAAAYKIAKEAHVKIVATQHRDGIKPAVYEALMNWEVEG